MTTGTPPRFVPDPATPPESTPGIEWRAPVAVTILAFLLIAVMMLLLFAQALVVRKSGGERPA